MASNPWPRVLAFFTWLLVGLSVAYWGLRLGEPAPDVRGAAPAPGLQTPAVDAAAVVRALGGGPAQAAAPSKRLELLGVVAEGRQGVALLMVDGQAAAPFRVGARIDDRLVLHAVGHRRADLADAATGAVVQRLEMPPAPRPELPPGIQWVQSKRP